MISPSHAQTMARYSRWMNERLYELCGALSDGANSLTVERLAEPLRYTSVTSPAPRSYPLWLAVTHFFNHPTNHRGQLTTLLKQSGVDPGVTDLIWLPRLQGEA